MASYVHSWPISVFPGRLKPILYVTGDAILIVDFQNQRLITIHRDILANVKGSIDTNVAIHRENDNIISIDVYELKKFIVSLKINLEIATARFDRCELVAENKQVQKISYENGSVAKIQWEDGSVLDCENPGRLTLTKKDCKRIPGKMIDKSGSLRLIKLHPCGSDRNYFCMNYANCLGIGTFRNGKLCVKKITHTFFVGIRRFSLMEDNVLMLEIRKAGCYHHLMFIDCNEVKILDCIDLTRSDLRFLYRASNIFVELTLLRKDYLILRRRYVPLMSDLLLVPLIEIVFSYVCGDMPP